MINRTNIIIFTLIFISILLTVFIIPNFWEGPTKALNLVIWIIIFAFSTFVINDHTRFKGKIEKIKTLAIILAIYYIVYMLIGLKTGFTRNAYVTNFGGAIKNILLIFNVVLLQEYVRARLINGTEKISMYIIITILFVILNINFTNIDIYFITAEKGFEYICSVLFVLIIEGALCSYLSKVGGFLLNFIYVIPLQALTLFSPILPDLDWFVVMTIKIVLVITAFLFVNYEHTIRSERFTRRELKGMNPIKSIPIICLILVFVGFVAGIFNYKPVAVMSYSMIPTFSRGDVVVCKKITKENIDTVKVGDILEYSMNNNFVIHRVKEITKDEKGNLLFTTKGDNNPTSDAEQVRAEQAIGTVKLSIPLIGYPAVWFAETVFSKKAVIDT